LDHTAARCTIGQLLLRQAANRGQLLLLASRLMPRIPRGQLAGYA
jgi:hypothetical protein